MKVKIFCHCCDGKGKIAEKEYPSRNQIMTVCPECNGDGWVWTEDIAIKQVNEFKVRRR